MALPPYAAAKRTLSAAALFACATARGDI